MIEENKSFIIRLARKEDAGAIARIHKEEINLGFLSELGDAFLTEFYRAIILSPGGFCVVAEDGGKVVGFIAGCESIGKFYKFFFKKHTAKALRILLPKAFNVGRVKKIFETLFYPQKEKDTPPAELLTIAVVSLYHGKGVAGPMFKEFVEEMKRREVIEFKVLVGESLSRAIAFYEKIGFIFHSKTAIHSNKPSKVYVYEIND